MTFNSTGFISIYPHTGSLIIFETSEKILNFIFPPNA